MAGIRINSHQERSGGDRPSTEGDPLSRALLFNDSFVRQRSEHRLGNILVDAISRPDGVEGNVLLQESLLKAMKEYLKDARDGDAISERLQKIPDIIEECIDFEGSPGGDNIPEKVQSAINIAVVDCLYERQIDDSLRAVRDGSGADIGLVDAFILPLYENISEELEIIEKSGEFSKLSALVEKLTPGLRGGHEFIGEAVDEMKMIHRSMDFRSEVLSRVATLQSVGQWGYLLARMPDLRDNSDMGFVDKYENLKADLSSYCLEGEQRLLELTRSDSAKKSITYCISWFRRKIEEIEDAKSDLFPEIRGFCTHVAQGVVDTFQSSRHLLSEHQAMTEVRAYFSVSEGKEIDHLMGRLNRFVILVDRTLNEETFRGKSFNDAREALMSAAFDTVISMFDESKRPEGEMRARAILKQYGLRFLDSQE